MRRMLLSSNDTPQDQVLNERDMQQMDEELTKKYSKNEELNKKKLLCESSDESS